MLTAEKNPLRMERLQQVPFRFPTGNWEENLSRLRQLNCRAAIVGKKGSGKTTLLAELAQRLPNSFYLNLPHTRGEHAELLRCTHEAVVEQKKILLVDGIERLTWLQRQKIYFLTASRSGLVVVVHRRCRLPTWVHCQTTPQLMRVVLDDLGVATPAVLKAAEEAFRQTRGNIRDALRLLYDEFAAGKLR